MEFRDGGAGGFLLRPYGLALHPLERAAAVLCGLLLGLVFVAEVVTPSTVVASAALIPLLAAGWLFSNRAASSVAIVAVGLFALGLIAEVGNRPTFIVVGVVTVAVVAATRLCAARLADLLSRPANSVSIQDRFAVDSDERLPHGIKTLTRRELEVARLAAQGRRASEISVNLHIGERTVESHLANIYSKLGINSRTKLVWMASLLPAASPSARRR